MRTYFVTLISVFLAYSLITPSHAATVKRGAINGKSVKWTQGTVKIEKVGGKYKIKLGGNFKTKKGPALFVYLGNGSPQKRIGRLKSTKGAQSYLVPRSIDPTKFSTLYIYCVPFKAVFGSARLR